MGPPAVSTASASAASTSSAVSAAASTGGVRKGFGFAGEVGGRSNRADLVFFAVFGVFFFKMVLVFFFFQS